jgi:4-hydroxy-2-oxoheptanedioate aldolase
MAVLALIDEAIARILQAGKAPGVIATSHELALHYLSVGAVFVAVGIDAQILMRGARDLVAQFKPTRVDASRTGAY